MGIYADVLRSMPASIALDNIAPGAGSLAQLGGNISAYVDDDKEYKGDYTGNKNFTPGWSAHNIAKQRMKSLKGYGADDEKMLAASEDYGHITSGILPALILAAAGGAIGYAAGGKAGQWSEQNDGNSGISQVEGHAGGAVLGSLTGAALGAGVPRAVAALAALFRRTRTKEEQKAYAKGSTKANWLIPGMSTYNWFKTTGRLHADQNEAEEAAAKKQRRKING